MAVLILNLADAVYPTELLIRNSDFEAAPSFVAATNTNQRWIDGTAAGSTTNDMYGWSTFVMAGSATARFDSSTSNSGVNSLKLSTLATGSQIQCGLLPLLSASKTPQYAVPIKPNTKYTVTCAVKTQLNSGSAFSGAAILFREVQADGVTLGSANAGSPILTTTGWTLYTRTFTTASTTAFIAVIPRVTGNDGSATLIMDAWFDDITITDGTNFIKIATKILTDTANTFDSVISKAVGHPLSDSVTPADAIVKKPVKNFGDSVASSDSSIRKYTMNPTDNVVPNDSWVNKVTKKPSDSVSPSDSIVRAITHPQSDSVASTDAIVKKPVKNFGDSVIPSDGLSITFGSGKTQTASDTVVTSDSLLFHVMHGIADSVTPAEAIIKSIAKPFSDSVTSADAVVRKTAKPMSDTVLTSDSSFRGIVLGRADSVGANDGTGRALQHNLADSITVVEAILKDRTIFFSDQVFIFDDARVYLNGNLMIVPNHDFSSRPRMTPETRAAPRLSL